MKSLDPKNIEIRSFGTIKVEDVRKGFFRENMTTFFSIQKLTTGFLMQKLLVFREARRNETT